MHLVFEFYLKRIIHQGIFSSLDQSGAFSRILSTLIFNSMCDCISFARPITGMKKDRAKKISYDISLTHYDSLSNILLNS